MAAELEAPVFIDWRLTGHKLALELWRSLKLTRVSLTEADPASGGIRVTLNAAVGALRGLAGGCCCEHGLPTAAVVRSSYATPARRRGQACGGGVRVCVGRVERVVRAKAGGSRSCAGRPLSGRTTLAWVARRARRPIDDVAVGLMPPHPTVLNTVRQKYCTGGPDSSTASAQRAHQALCGLEREAQRGLAGCGVQRRYSRRRADGTEVSVRARRLPGGGPGVQPLRPRPAVLQRGMPGSSTA